MKQNNNLLHLSEMLYYCAASSGNFGIIPAIVSLFWSKSDVEGFLELFHN